MYIIKAPLCRIPGSECECYVESCDGENIHFTGARENAATFDQVRYGQAIITNFEAGRYQIMSDTMPCDDDLQVESLETY